MNQTPQNPPLASDHTDNNGAVKETSAVSNWLTQPGSMAIAIAVLFILISGMAAFLCYRQYENVKNKALSADQMTSELLAVFIREREKAISGLLQAHAGKSSFIIALKNSDKAALRKHLAQLKKNSELDLALVTNQEGIVQAQNPLSQNDIGKNLSAQKWYKEVAARLQPHTSPIAQLAVGEQTPSVVIGVPVWNETEELIGVLATAQRLDFIARGIGKLQLSADAGISVIDPAGHIFYSSRHSYLNNITPYPAFSLVAQAFKDDTRQIIVDTGGGFGSQRYLSLTTVRNTRWRVVTEREQEDILQAAYGNFIEIALMCLLLFTTLSIFIIYLRKVFLFKKTADLLQTEIQLRQSEHRLSELFENMSSCVAIYEAVADGRDFIFKEINQAVERAEHIDRKDVIGKSVFEIFNGVKEYGLFDLLQRVWRTGVPENLAARYYQEDRRSGWKENSVYKLPTGEIVVIYNDVSKRKRAEEALKRSEETFTKVFKANPVAIVICRPGDGYILDVNAAFENLIGYRREELIGRTALELGLWADTKEHDTALQTLSRQSAVADQEIHLLTKSGKTLITRYSAQTVKLATQSCLLSIIVDITATKQAQEERLKLEKQLYESQKMEAIGTLAGGIAHDFNNILGAIIGYAEMAAHQSDQKKLRRYNDQILAAADRAKNLVTQILAFSRHGEHDKKTMDLRIITKETLKLLRSTMPTTIDICCNIENLPFTISGDATQMHQIIMNICTNAAHAMGEKDGTLNVGITKEMLTNPQASDLHLSPGSYVRLSIADTGQGIDPAIIDRIFDPFFTTKKIGEGTGLGLSVVYGIVKNHDGHIQVQSKPGLGATFDIYLPYLSAQATVAEASYAEPVAGGQERILFVDDEKALVDLASRNLSDLGYAVTTCLDSREALNIFQSNPDGFDLIITDMTMPHLSGSELSRQIVGMRPEQSIMLCTGYSQYITPEKATQMGIKAFILKPLSGKALAAAVRKTLDENSGSCAERSYR